MISITLHDLDDRVAAELRARAAEHGRSPEQEACAILSDVLGNGEAPSAEPPENLATGFREIFREYHREFGDVELPIPPREPPREPPTFD
ncbi:MAG: plasmid stabilization protein [Chloroflexi bacterium]|nr:plasmid stabilization protein [Chloroflexota bacterium]